LDDLLALIEGCHLFIGNDSGPTHAAAALGRPLVVVWGSSSFEVWHPWETEYEVVRLQLPCMPCPGHNCAVYGAPRCIDDIPVDHVFDATKRFLGPG
jgi:ADP-heptose:LPS heptosyltransferase